MEPLAQTGSKVLRTESEELAEDVSTVFAKTEIKSDEVKSNGELERDKWDSKIDFLLSVIGFAVDLANIWRFPYLCYKNGGGAFLIPYVLMVILAGVPLFLMELSLGQYYRKGAITAWGSICPLFKGIGYCVIITAFYTDFFYNVIISWALHYFLSSFSTKLPWTSCGGEYNSIACYEPSKKFLGLHQSGAPNSSIVRTFGDYGSINWEIVICLLLVYIICYFSLWRGIKMSGKVVWFTAIFPYIVLSALLIRGITLPGAQTGINYYLKPNLEALKNPHVWQDAATQVFFSLGPGFGVLMAYASYNDFYNNVYRDALVTSTINCVTSFMSGFVIFSVLGYMSCKSGKSIDEVAQEGPGLVFVVYPEALATMPGAAIWSILFFLMLLTLGLDSSFGGTEAIITALSDEFTVVRKNRAAFIAILFVLYMVVGLFMCAEGGMLVMEWLIFYGTSWGLIIAVFCETIVVSYIYGIKRYTSDFEDMMGFKPGCYWQFCWLLAAPAVLLVIIVSSFTHYQPLVYQDYEYSYAANALGLIFALTSVAFIPIFAINQLLQGKGNGFSEKFVNAITTRNPRMKRQSSDKETTEIKTKISDQTQQCTTVVRTKESFGSSVINKAICI